MKLRIGITLKRKFIGRRILYITTAILLAFTFVGSQADAEPNDGSSRFVTRTVGGEAIKLRPGER